MYKVQEINYSIHSEAKFIGVPIIYIKFGGCDYACSWCDSFEASAYANKNLWLNLSISEIINKIKALGYCKTIVLTGGNPAIYDLKELVVQLKCDGYKIHCETQGSKFKEWLNLCDVIELSPKPPSAEVPDTDIARFLKKLVTDYIIKIPIFSRKDLEFVLNLANKHNLRDELIYLVIGDRDNIYKRYDELKKITEEILRFIQEHRREFNVSAQLYKFLGLDTRQN